VDTQIYADSVLMDSISPNIDIQLTQAIVIQSGEDDFMRWVSISPGSRTADSRLPYPVLLTDANAGSFTLQILDLDTTAYLGSRMLRDHGHFPIHYRIDFPDSSGIQISGKTLPYDDISCFYSFDRDEYRIEFVFKDQAEKKITTPQGKQNPVVLSNAPNNGAASQKLNRNIMAGKASEFKGMLLNSIYIALAALGLTVLVYFLMKYLKEKMKTKPIAGHNFADLLDEKADASNQDSVNKEPEILTPQLKEEKIRVLMDVEKLSYDEAALRVQYQTMNQVDDQPV